MKIEIIVPVVLVAIIIGVAVGCSRRKQSSSGSISVSLEPGKPFPWHKGTTLVATEPATIVLPGAILVDGTAVGDIITATDDNMEIGFTPKQDGPGFETIILKFQKGQGVTLARSSEAILMDEQNQPRTFMKKEP